MKCKKCGRERGYSPQLQGPGGATVVGLRSHADAEQWAHYCQKCQAGFCGQCCLPEWQALKAKEGLSGRELAAKLDRDPKAFFFEQPKCPQCGEDVRSEAPKSREVVSSEAKDFRTKETKSGDRGCLIGCIAFLFSMLVPAPLYVVLNKNGYENAEIVMLVIWGIALLTSLVATIVGFSKRAGPDASSAAKGALCTICGTILDTQRYARGLVCADDLMNPTRTAYRCRSCGSLVCINCAKTIPCRNCNGRVFDVALK